MYIDIVGFLFIIVDGYRYCIIMIDCFIGWLEVFLFCDILVEIVVEILFNGWIVCFGCFVKFMSD